MIASFYNYFNFCFNSRIEYGRTFPAPGHSSTKLVGLGEKNNIMNTEK